MGGFESYPSYPAPSYPAPNYPAPGLPAIPYASPESAPALSPQNTGFRQGYSAGSAVASTGNPAARATVVIKLPSDARLFAENKALTLTGAERKFVSPELPQGQEFAYRFRVEYERDGETLSVTRKVVVRSGSVLAVEFNDMTARTPPEKNNGASTVAATPSSMSAPIAVPTVTTASTTATGTTTSTVTPVPANAPPAVPAIATATTTGTTSTLVQGTTATPPAAQTEGRALIRVKLPPGATLFVDEQRSPSTELVRQFSTPPLPVGKEFAYLMKAEVLRNGQMETVTQRVPFRAGERVEVDFTVPNR